VCWRNSAAEVWEGDSMEEKKSKKPLIIKIVIFVLFGGVILALAAFTDWDLTDIFSCISPFDKEDKTSGEENN